MSLTEFHPVVRRWFIEKFGSPSPPQSEGWPHIRAGRNTLIAAPTGTGKTFAAFLWAIDDLIRRGSGIPDETRVLYVSPLKALGNDVQKNLEQPLAELRAIDPALPGIRVLVRSGDTTASARAAMKRHPPHILVTTPESLYILLTSDSGRAMLRTVRTVIVDEIHAVAGDKRGSHLALSLERLESLAGSDAPVQRIGLSATQKPLRSTADLLFGTGRDGALVDVGHRRDLDLAVEIPDSPLDAVCSNETWSEIYARIAALVTEHRTTLVFVNTRKLAERLAARLGDILGAEKVSSHHGSLSRERRLEAEQRLKTGHLRALVATASLELGIDVGDVDLVVQIGITPSIAILLQRVGRAGHALSRTPKGRLFPLTRDELVCAAALMQAIRRGELDRTPQPGKPLDILAQQVVAACVPETREEDDLFASFRRAWPYRDLPRDDFDAVVALHSQGRRALLHRDGVHRRLRATRRARIVALTSGGAIPDNADYKVLLEPEGSVVGTLNEDFAIESNVGDIFQLGNSSWSILKVESGVVRVADARGAPPTIPFWLGEGPARSNELSEAIGRILEGGRDPSWLARETGMSEAASRQIAEYIESGAQALGAVPGRRRLIAERFFDESGGMQLVIHSPFGGRINRAWGLALRKRICRAFGFELQAAANEDAIVISLGPQHSFPLEEIFDYLHPNSARDVLVQALLAAPLFATRWRWNLTRSLLLSRTGQGGRRVPSPLLRMRADDLLAEAFPEVIACGETLPPGDLPVPWDHPIVRQTVEDGLTEAMDVDGLIDVLHGLRDGTIERVAVDLPEPSVFAHGILNAKPYAFLDDAPLEERRTQAVMTRRSLDPATADTIGALDPDAVARVREEAWPQPENAEEVHEALLWMGYVTGDEAERSEWTGWLADLAAQGRVIREAGRFLAVEAPRDPKSLLRGRLEALGPIFADRLPGDAGSISPEEREQVPALEREGVVLRCRLERRTAWCERRLLARIHRYTLDALRRQIEPVSAAAFWRFLVCWQHIDEEHRLEGPRGVAEIVRQLAGFEIPAAAWEASVLPARVGGYRPEWLDQITLTGEVVWGRLWGAGSSPVRATPICLLPREDLDLWRAMAGTSWREDEVPGSPSFGDGDRSGGTPVESGAGDPESVGVGRASISSIEGVIGVPEKGPRPLSSHARAVLDALHARGALFTQELERHAGPLPSHVEIGLAELIAFGLVTCDSFSGLRQLLMPPHKRQARSRPAPFLPAGRWCLFRRDASGAPAMLDPAPRGGADGSQYPAITENARAEFAAMQLLRRYGVVFKRIVQRERIPVPWRDVIRVYRRMELRGDVRGGRFVGGFAGEQYALPGAVELLRKIRNKAAGAPVSVSASDPLNLQGILTPDPRVSPQTRRRVVVG